MQIILSDYGEYLGTKDTFNIVVFKKGEMLQCEPVQQIDTVYLTEGNSASTSALSLCSLFNIPVFILSKTGKILSTNMPFHLNSECRVKTRLAQYRSKSTKKGMNIAKQLLIAKIRNQSTLLEKHGYKLSISGTEKKIIEVDGKLMPEKRAKLNAFESKISKNYFTSYFNLIPKTFDIKSRKNYRAKDRVNNMLNLGYEILKTEIFKAIMPTHLDPFMGYLHSDQHTKPSLICDMQEPFRCAVDELLITYVRELDPKEDFRLEGQRWYLTSEQNKEYIIALNKMFEERVEYNRRGFGKRCTLRTVIREEALKLGLYLRGEKRKYIPYTF